MSITLDHLTEIDKVVLLSTASPNLNKEQKEAIERYNLWIERLINFCTNRSTRHEAWKNGKLFDLKMPDLEHFPITY